MGSRLLLRRAALAVALVLAASLVTSTSSLAAATVTITSPVAGSAHPVGYTGPLAIGIAPGSDAGAYALAVTGPGGYAWQASWMYDGSQSANTWSLDPATAPGTYTVTVTAPDASVAVTTTFTVEAPLGVLWSSASPSTFYPLERDGYRDATVVRFQTNLAAAAVVTVRNHLGQVVRSLRLGTLSRGAVHAWVWRGKKDSGRLADPGYFRIRVAVTRAGVTRNGPRLSVRLAARPAALLGAGVSPRAFYPIERDGFRDFTHFRFTTTLRARDTIRVIDGRGRLVRTAVLGVLSGRHAHGWRWGGRTNAGRMLRAGTYRINVTTLRYDRKVVGNWHAVHLRRKSSGGGGGGGGGGDGSCTPGYSPCLVNHSWADYDCSGGGGNGPYYTDPNVVYRVTGSDPYGLDADNDTYGCE